MVGYVAWGVAHQLTHWKGEGRGGRKEGQYHLDSHGSSDLTSSHQALILKGPATSPKVPETGDQVADGCLRHPGHS